MQRLRFLDTLGVFCALLCASYLLVVQNGYACSSTVSEQSLLYIQWCQ